ncbi:MAG: hypothetical protein COB66_00700, partial [Coxiella sp. (in: Bacteria)]
MRNTMLTVALTLGLTVSLTNATASCETDLVSIRAQVMEYGQIQTARCNIQALGSITAHTATATMRPHTSCKYA